MQQNITEFIKQLSTRYQLKLSVSSELYLTHALQPSMQEASRAYNFIANLPSCTFADHIPNGDYNNSANN